MADKVGANKFFVRIFLVGFLLALLLVGALLSIFYHGTLSTYITISLVLLPCAGLLAIYISVVLAIFHKGEARLDKALDEAKDSPLVATEAKSIIIYGSEFSDPFYKQLTIPPFVGKALPKSGRSRSSGRATSRNRTIQRASYADYTDTYNGVTQGQMSFDNWMDILRDEPMVVEVADRQATLVGQLTDADLSEYRAALFQEQPVIPTVADVANVPSIEAAADPESTVEIDAQAVEPKATRPRKPKAPRERITRKRGTREGNSRESVASGVEVVEVEPVLVEPVVAAVSVPAAIRKKSTPRVTTSKSKSVATPRKIITHKKPANDKRDDYVYIRQPVTDTNQPIKLMLSERFDNINTTTTRSASQELLAKMRRDNIRR